MGWKLPGLHNYQNEVKRIFNPDDFSVQPESCERKMHHVISP